jgi:hypothetical protein
MKDRIRELQELLKTCKIAVENTENELISKRKRITDSQFKAATPLIALFMIGTDGTDHKRHLGCMNLSVKTSIRAKTMTVHVSYGGCMGSGLANAEPGLKRIHPKLNINYLRKYGKIETEECDYIRVTIPLPNYKKAHEE